MKKTVTICVFLCSIIMCHAQVIFTKKYLMPYHYCSGSNCGNPMNHTTTIAESNDGVNWTGVANMPVLPGSVPDAVIRDTVMYLYNPGSLRRYSFNTHQFTTTPTPVSIKDSNNYQVNFVDPSPIIDANGRIVLFYLNSTGLTGDPASCPSYPCTKYFDSAIEVPGSDGSQFVQQSGHRLSLTITAGTASDPDIYFDGTNYILYISTGSNTKACFSNQLNGSYTVFPNLPSGVITNNGGIPSGYFDPVSNNYWTYVHSNNGGTTEIRRITHTNFNAQANGYNTVMTGQGMGHGANSSVASPGFLENTFLTLGLKEVNDIEKVAVYPNPFVDKLNIDLHDLANKKVQISLFNILGEMLYSSTLSSTSNEVDFNAVELKNGIYFLEIKTPSFKIYKKCIKN